jgi:hypothetical protein
LPQQGYLPLQDARAYSHAEQQRAKAIHVVWLWRRDTILLKHAKFGDARRCEPRQTFRF